MWHELSHVYVLNMTNFRVPRWFTEGLAVHEETAASPEWGDRLDPARHHGDQGQKAAARRRVRSRLCASDLSRAGGRILLPGRPYLRLHQREWGWPKLLAMIHDFAAGASTPEVIEKELGIKPEEFDKRFLPA